MRKLMKYLKPYVVGIILLIVLVGVQVFCELSLPNIMRDIIDKGVNTDNPSIEYILMRGLVMMFYTLGATIAVIFVNFLSARISMGFGAKIRKVMFEKIQSFSLEEMGKVGTASLITRTTNDVLQVQTLVYQVLRMMIMAPLIFIGGLVFSISIGGELLVVLLVSVPIIAIVIAIIGKFAMPVFTSMQKKMDNLTRVTREGLTGVRVIRAFNQQEHEAKRFEDVNMDLTKTIVKGNRLMSVLMPSIMLVMNLTTVAIVLVGGYNNTLAGDIMAVIQYATQIMFSLVMIAMLFVMFPRAAVSAKRINEVLSIDLSIQDSNEIAELLEDKKGSVEFQNVSFYFPGSEEATIKDISFCSKAGETTAIIGSTGSGKSTMINLIPRFYDITDSNGAILVGGVNVKNIPIKDLRDMIGFVPQKSNLFSGTILSNVLDGKNDASEQEVLEALRISQSSDFVLSLDEGVNSYVAQGGTNYSGGQKQRLCIARAVVRKPDIYVFDDSFSALDFKTDKNLRAELKKVTKNSTVLIVAQRVSTIMDADRILVLDEGKMVGMDTHKQLLETCSVYKEIVLSQLEEEEV